MKIIDIEIFIFRNLLYFFLLPYCDNVFITNVISNFLN